MKGLSCNWFTGTGKPAGTATPTNNTERLSAAAAESITTGDSAVAPTPSSSHSLESPSPSPQPGTPDDLSHIINPINYFGTRAASKPIDITATSIRFSPSASPSALFPRPADGNSTKQPDHSDFGDVLLDEFAIKSFDRNFFDREVEMTTGPALDSAFGRGRHDSFVSAGPKPISMNPNRDNGRARRESLAGSLMNGMSWGGLSVGSFIRDE